MNFYSVIATSLLITIISLTATSKELSKRKTNIGVSNNFLSYTQLTKSLPLVKRKYISDLKWAYLDLEKNLNFKLAANSDLRNESHFSSIQRWAILEYLNKAYAVPLEVDQNLSSDKMGSGLCLIGGQFQPIVNGRCSTRNNGCEGKSDGFYCGSIFGHTCIDRIPVRSISKRCFDASTNEISEDSYNLLKTGIETTLRWCESNAKIGCQKFKERIQSIQKKAKAEIVAEPSLNDVDEKPAQIEEKKVQTEKEDQKIESEPTDRQHEKLALPPQEASNPKDEIKPKPILKTEVVSCTVDQSIKDKIASQRSECLEQTAGYKKATTYSWAAPEARPALDYAWERLAKISSVVDNKISNIGGQSNCILHFSEIFENIQSGKDVLVNLDGNEKSLHINKIEAQKVSKATVGNELDRLINSMNLKCPESKIASSAIGSNSSVGVK